MIHQIQMDMMVIILVPCTRQEINPASVGPTHVLQRASTGSLLVSHFLLQVSIPMFGYLNWSYLGSWLHGWWSAGNSVASTCSYHRVKSGNLQSDDLISSIYCTQLSQSSSFLKPHVSESRLHFCGLKSQFLSGYRIQSWNRGHTNPSRKTSAASSARNASLWSEGLNPDVAAVAWRNGWLIQEI